MATQYIKSSKKREKVFFFQILGRGHGLFWPEGGYAHEAIIVLVGLVR